MSNTHEWCADGIDPQFEVVQDKQAEVEKRKFD